MKFIDLLQEKEKPILYYVSMGAVHFPIKKVDPKHKKAYKKLIDSGARSVAWDEDGVFITRVDDDDQPDVLQKSYIKVVNKPPKAYEILSTNMIKAMYSMSAGDIRADKNGLPETYGEIRNGAKIMGTK